MAKCARVLGALPLVVICLIAFGRRASAEKSVEEIRAAIEQGVDRVIAEQQPDGSWPDIPAETGRKYPVGRTALATLALLHSHSPKANAAIQKGLAFIVQQWPESKTYTAGLVEQCLYKAGVDRYRKQLDAYGWMLSKSQSVQGTMSGCYNYDLMPYPKDFGSKQETEPSAAILAGGGDHSNTQFGILGLIYAQKAGFQVPKEVWRRAQAHYIGAQNPDGGWEYHEMAFLGNLSPSTSTMTLAGTVSLYLVNEMLYADKHDQCKPPPRSEGVEKGLDWIAKHWTKGLSPYGWYGTERIGILMGLSEFGGHDWYQEGADVLCPMVSAGGRAGTTDLCFGILFLSRGLEPIVINKLKRTGDWNLHLHDVQHLTEYITDKFQLGKQWRIVTLNASQEQLQKVPILWISGHENLVFTADEKAKLKQYVEQGGTILGEACCSQKAFDDSFRALLAELWPGTKLTELPPSHAVFQTPRVLKNKLKILGLALEANQGRFGVLYIPNGISCQWERGGTTAVAALDVGANITFYVEKVASRVKPPEQAAPERAPAVPAPETPVETPPKDAAPNPEAPKDAAPAPEPPKDPAAPKDAQDATPPVPDDAKGD